MQRKSVFLMAAMFVFGLLMCAANAHAFGIGPYFEFASGSGSFNESNAQLYMRGDDGDIDTDIAGFGFVMDSNLSKRKLFNYRFSLGYNTVSYPDGIDGWNVSMDNTFGFGIVKTDRFRLWLGPQIHLSYGAMEIPLYSGYSYYNYYDDYDDFTDDVNVLGAGIGLVTGANFNLPRVGSICAELGVRAQTNQTDTFEGYISDSGYEYNDWTGEYEYYNYSYYYDDVDYSYNETVIFFKLSFMFGK